MKRKVKLRSQRQNQRPNPGVRLPRPKSERLERERARHQRAKGERKEPRSFEGPWMLWMQMMFFACTSPSYFYILLWFQGTHTIPHQIEAAAGSILAEHQEAGNQIVLSIFIQHYDCLCFLKVVAKFREEVARDIQDSRFTVPRDLSNVKPLDCLIMVCLYVDIYVMTLLNRTRSQVIHLATPGPQGSHYWSLAAGLIYWFKGLQFHDFGVDPSLQCNHGSILCVTQVHCAVLLCGAGYAATCEWHIPENGGCESPPKARYGLAISKPIYTYFALSALQVNASRKSVTLSWGKLGGLPAALGALSSQH